MTLNRPTLNHATYNHPTCDQLYTMPTRCRLSVCLLTSIIVWQQVRSAILATAGLLVVYLRAIAYLSYSWHCTFVRLVAACF